MQNQRCEEEWKKDLKKICLRVDIRILCNNPEGADSRGGAATLRTLRMSHCQQRKARRDSCQAKYGPIYSCTIASTVD